MHLAAAKFRVNTTIKPVQRWLNEIVIGLNLCPFAKREVLRKKVRFTESQASNEEQLLNDLTDEFKLLSEQPQIETSLLIHPLVLQDFVDYNQFLNIVDLVLIEMQLDGVYQVASFHPDYQFSGTQFDDPENFTNRSPYPLLHILREDSLEKAIDRYPNTELIPESNIQLMEQKGADQMRAMLAACVEV